MSNLALGFLLFAIPLGLVHSATDLDDSPSSSHQHDDPYCFRFTWIGPKFNSDSEIGNLTCNELLDDTKGLPCRRPLVATDNSNLPDTKSMWMDNLKDPTKIACKLSRGDVCVKYAFMYNNIVENITYMCTKVTIDGEGPAPLRCYKQKLANGRSVQTCVCESSRGQIPCNAASLTLEPNMTMFVGIVLLCTIKYNLNEFINT